MSEPRVGLSLIVPAYEERGRIGGALDAIAEALPATDPTSELVVVDDGSRDGTFEAVRKRTAVYPVPVRLVRYTGNRGKGHALKVGFALARGERLLFSDADLSVSIDQAGNLLDALAAGAEVAIGSRRAPGADLAARQPWLREAMGRVFTQLVCRLIGPVSDATCGFKAFRREAGRDLFAHLRVPGWAFDAELLWLARARGYRVREVPVSWVHEPATKVRLGRDALESFAGLLRVRWYAWRGAYARPCAADPDLEIWESRPDRRASPRADSATGGMR